MSEAVDRNLAESRRLADLAATLTAAQLGLIVHDRWTVAAKLAHLAFWDRFALAVLGRWVAGQPSRIDIPDWYDDVLNDAVFEESLALEPARAIALATAAASALDARLTGMRVQEATRLEEDAARPETDANWLLHRHRHRSLHLDEIEAALRRAAP